MQASIRRWVDPRTLAFIGLCTHVWNLLEILHFFNVRDKLIKKFYGWILLWLRFLSKSLIYSIRVSYLLFCLQTKYNVLVFVYISSLKNFYCFLIHSNLFRWNNWVYNNNNIRIGGTFLAYAFTRRYCSVLVDLSILL